MTVERVIEIKKMEGGDELQTWEYFRKLLQYLSVGGMSSEEESVEKIGNRTMPVFLVKWCVWREKGITDYLRHIDKAAGNPALWGKRGSRLTPRIDVEEESTSGVPTGLPRKMYDPTWLAEQEKKRPYFVKEELRVSEEAFELLVLAADDVDM
jgi:hypothetical protein